jgi:pilin isopeptide linkage protein
VSTDTGFAVDVVFSNTFKPPVAIDDITVPITVNKTVVNKGAYKRSAEGFEFILEDKFGDKKSFKSDKDGVAVTDIIIAEADAGDLLTYKIYEKNTGEKGITYDEKIYNVEIAVSVDENNKLIADVEINSERTEEIKAQFENICVQDKPVTPDTRDSMLYWWALLALLSASGCVILIVTDRKCSKQNAG